MTPDERIDEIMKGPFDGIGRYDHVYEPPSPEVEAAMRAFMRALVAARPDVPHEIDYDAMHGLIVEIGSSPDYDEKISVVMWNGSDAATICGPGLPYRERPVSAPFATAESLVPETLARLDRAAARAA